MNMNKISTEHLVIAALVLYILMNQREGSIVGSDNKTPRRNRKL